MNAPLCQFQLISEELVSKAFFSCGVLFKTQLILKGLLGVFKSTNLFLKARAETLTENLVGFLVDLKTPKSPFEIN